MAYIVTSIYSRFNSTEKPRHIYIYIYIYIYIWKIKEVLREIIVTFIHKYVKVLGKITMP